MEGVRIGQMVQWGQNGSSGLEGVRKGQEGPRRVRRGQEVLGGVRRVQEGSSEVRRSRRCQKGHHKVVYKFRYSGWALT